jgi:Na+-translocating ferredoxin:NAD+ oxidoreductase RNF subunit RnfB
MAVASKERIREIYEVLPKVNCGLCGFGSCGQFARAVTEARASPFGCRQNPWVGYKISEIMGVKAPAFRPQYEFYQPVSAVRATPLSAASLRKEVEGLARAVDDILTRIEKSTARRC